MLFFEIIKDPGKIPESPRLGLTSGKVQSSCFQHSDLCLQIFHGDCDLPVKSASLFLSVGSKGK
jgi:hypothetical protein